MSDDEVADYIIGRLGELVAYILADHVGDGEPAVKVRQDSEGVLLALGNWAAHYGRADLMPVLHGLAHRVAEHPRTEANRGAMPKLDAALVRRAQ